MNFIVIVSDTLRRDHVGCYGGAARTPALDRLAGESVVFDEFYSGSFPTLPCRAELFTGRFVWPYLDWGPLPANEVTLAETLAGAGYHCALIMDNLHLARAGYGYDRGFHTRIHVRGQWYDPYVTGASPDAVHVENDGWRHDGVPLPCPPEKLGRLERVAQYLRNAALRRCEADYPAPQVFTEAIRWLEEQGRKTPFLLHLDVFDPHEPWDPPREDADAYFAGGLDVIHPVMGPAGRYTPEELRRIRALYAGEVTLVDRWLGRLLETVDALGLRDDTALFFLSDHGVLLGERGLLGKMGGKKETLCGWPTYPELSRVPLLARVPGVAPRRSRAFCHPGDLMPTLLDLARVPPPSRVQGASLVPVLQHRGERVRDFSLSSWSLRDGSRHRPSVLRTGEWAFYFWRGDVPPQLYHRASDPGETVDVLDGNRVVARELHRQYVRFLREHETPARNYWPRRFLFPPTMRAASRREPAGRSVLSAEARVG